MVNDISSKGQHKLFQSCHHLPHKQNKILCYDHNIFHPFLSHLLFIIKKGFYCLSLHIYEASRQNNFTAFWSVRLFTEEILLLGIHPNFRLKNEQVKTPSAHSSMAGKHIISQKRGRRKERHFLKFLCKNK